MTFKVFLCSVPNANQSLISPFSPTWPSGFSCWEIPRTFLMPESAQTQPQRSSMLSFSRVSSTHSHTDLGGLGRRSCCCRFCPGHGDGVGEYSHRHYCPPSTHPIIDSPNERWLTRFHFHQILALDLSPTEEVPACVLSIIHSTAVQDMRKWMRNIGILACQEWIPEHSWDPPKPNHFLQYKNEHRERERKKGVQRHNLPWHSLDQQ